MNNQSRKVNSASNKTSLKRTNQISARIHRQQGLIIKNHEFYQLELKVNLNKTSNNHTYTQTTIQTTLLSPIVFVLTQTEDSFSAISLDRVNSDVVNQIIFLYNRKMFTDTRINLLKQTLLYSPKKGNSFLQESPIRTYLIKNVIAIKELSPLELLPLLNNKHKPTVISRK